MAHDGGASNPARRAGVDAVEIPINYAPVPFMRMLAKIAWGYTVVRDGVDAVEPAVLGVVLGISERQWSFTSSITPFLIIECTAASETTS